MKSLQLLLGKEETTRNVSPVVNLEQVVSIENTILDEEVQANGISITLNHEVVDLFNRTIDTITLPPLRHTQVEGVVLLHPLSVLFNNLLRLNEQVEEKKVNPRYLAKSVKRYQVKTISTLAGKNGQLNRFCVTARTKLSLRAVALPNAHWSPEWIGIPGHLMDKVGKKHGALCLAVRFPGIWDGSVEIFKARKTPHNCVELHPLLHKQFNLDHDGDTISVYWVPDTKECQEEAQEKVIDFLMTQANPTWPGVLGEKPGKPDLSNLEKVTQETKKRLPLDGFSISPKDIIDGANNPCIKRLEKITGKKLIERNMYVAQGLKKSEFMKNAIDVNTTNVVTKLYMGPVGAMANKIKIICISAPEHVKRSSMDISAKLQQSLLDVKHLVGDIENEKFIQTLEVLNRTYPNTRYAMPGKIIKIMDKLGIPSDVSTPFVGYIYWTYPGMLLTEKYEENIQFSSVVKKAFMNVTEASAKDVDKEAIFAFNVLLEHSKPPEVGTEEWRPQLSTEFWKLTVGVNEIVKREYPVFQLIGKNGEYGENMLKLAERVLINGENDKQGICRTTLDSLAEEVIQCH